MGVADTGASVRNTCVSVRNTYVSVRHTELSFTLQLMGTNEDDDDETPRPK